MLVQASKLRLAAAIMLFAPLAGVCSLPAQAADAESIAHRAIRAKILKEANDRSDIRFLTTTTTRAGGDWRKVLGSGRFRRVGKKAQDFTYHTTVNIRNRADKDTGYNIH